MKRKVTVAIIIIVCYLLQSTLFQTLSFATISPNLMIVITSAFGFMRGQKEGTWIGLFCGLCMDIFSGSTVGFYALLYMYVGFFNGYFRKLFYPEDIKLPMLLIGGSDLVYNLAIYFFLFLFRNRYEFGYYFVNITMLVTIVLYMILLKINQRLELIEKRSAKKFV